MTSEQRRYERLLERERRGLLLRPQEAAELAHYQATLPLAQRERAALGELRQWLHSAPTEVEKQSLARLERAALVRSRHNSRASLRLLVSDDPSAVGQWRADSTSIGDRIKALVSKRRTPVVVGLLLASAGALAFGTQPWKALRPAPSHAESETPKDAPAAQPTSAAQPPALSPAPQDSRQASKPTVGVAATAPEISAPPSQAQVRALPRTEHFGQAPSPSARASDLLARAREALRQRDAKRALARYRELVRTFPNSSEAASVRVTVAQLELQIGSAKDALAGFERYLKHGGSLAPEALAGKVQALMALGRRQQAKQAMREYLVRFPSEVHSQGYRRALAP